MMVYALADRLNKTIPEILQMSVGEFAGWLAYFKVLGER